MNYIFSIMGALVIGLCVALEPVINSGLGKIISPRLATMHSFIVGTILIVLINVFSGGFKQYGLIVKAPPYLWIGGILGLLVVLLGAIITPQLGAASTITLIVGAQIICSIVIDSLGLFGVQKVPLDLQRLIGAVMILIAVKLIIR